MHRRARRSAQPLDLNAFSMPYLSKIVLHCPNGEPSGLDALVEAFLKDGVIFVGVVGKDASRIEDIIDEIVVGDGSDESRFTKITTSFHEHETVEDVLEFARSWKEDHLGQAVQLVRL